MKSYLHSICAKFKNIITIEDGTIIGGLGSAVVEFINDNHYNTSVKRLGVPDSFIEQGTVAELHRICGCDVKGIVDTATGIANGK